jgi:hypothetical protein
VRYLRESTKFGCLEGRILSFVSFQKTIDSLLECMNQNLEGSSSLWNSKSLGKRPKFAIGGQVFIPTTNIIGYVKYSGAEHILLKEVERSMAGRTIISQVSNFYLLAVFF